MAEQTQNAIHYLAVVSDLHCGSLFGLCPPEGIAIDDGGTYQPSKLQRTVWGWWEEFWQWVQTQTDGAPFAVCCNGDALDGAPHQSVAQISDNRKVQQDIAVAVLEPIVALCKGKYYHVRGTEAHVGKSGQEEEKLAHRLKAVPNSEGQYARWELWLKIGEGLVHLTHHIGTTGSMAYETSAVMKEIEQMLVDAAAENETPPDVVIRSHRHRNVEARKQTSRGLLTGCTTAGWQLKTPFTYKVPGARRVQPHFGGTLVCWHPNDRIIYTQHKLWHLHRNEPEVP